MSFVLSAACLSEPWQAIDPIQLRLSDFWLKQNSFEHQVEYTKGEDQFFFSDYLSGFDGQIKLRTPQLIWQNPEKFQIILGEQLDVGHDPLLPRLPWTGLRADLFADDWLYSGSLGRTTSQNLPRLVLRPNDIPVYDTQVFDVARRLGEQGEARLSYRGFQPVQAATFRHDLLSLHVDPDLEGPWQLSGSYGLDLSGVNGSAGRDRRAFNWQFGYRSPLLNFSASENATGRAYGPAVEDNFNRGNRILLADARLNLTENLDLFESYRRLRFEFPIESGPITPSSNESFLHQLNWNPEPNLRFSTQYQTTLIEPGLRSRQFDLSSSWQPQQNLSFNGRLSRLRFEQGHSSIESLSVDYSPVPQLRLSLGLVNNDTIFSGLASKGQQLALGSEYLFGEDLGFVRAEYARFLDGPRELSNLSFLAEITPTPRWKLSGRYFRNDGRLSGPAQQYRLGLSYLFNENNEVSLGYEKNPFLQDLLGSQSPLDTSQIVSLRLVQSWGGASSQAFRQRLRPRLTVRAHSTDGAPLEKLRLALGDDQFLELGPEGTLDLRDLEAGDYRLQLDTSKLGPNYEILDPVSPVITLKKGGRHQVEVKAKAWSSVEVVCWNDAQGSGEIPLGFIPIKNVSVALEPKGKVLEINTRGAALFEKLEPGTYRVSLLQKPENMATTTPTEREVEIKAGEAKVLVFGLQGFGTLAGRVHLLGEELQQALPILAEGQEIGTTLPDGSYRFRVPAGELKVSIDTSQLGSDLYSLEAEPPTLNLAVGEEKTQNFSLARYARLTVRLASGRSGVPVELAGQGFLYSDDQGEVVFDRLKIGEYRLTVKGKLYPLTLTSGEHKRMELP